MDNQNQTDWFNDIETIVSEPLNFKAKLAIGEDAYAALKLKNAATKVWDVAGVATTAAVVAKSSVVATTFFAPTGFLALLGIGTAVTPVGWVIAASVITGGTWMGITRYLKKSSDSRVMVIPKFINTPLDVLALSLFDLLAPLALKVATTEGSINQAKQTVIHDYFVKAWGFDPDFVSEGMKYTESKLSEFSIDELAQALAEFANRNRDCNFKMMSQEILGFLRNIVNTEGQINNYEEIAVDKIEAVFKKANKTSLGKKVQSSWHAIKKVTGKVFSKGKLNRGSK
ncbi:MAG: hypothetical protein ACI8P9_004884 [Parasphingorhabdus sp.]|jgi:hypothetical protein